MYASKGDKTRIFVPSIKRKLLDSVHDHVRVTRKGWAYFLDIVNEFDPDIIAVHAPRGRWLSWVLQGERPIITYIHGAEALFEALHHYFTPFSLKDNVSKGLSLSMDFIKLVQLRSFLKASTAIVYASSWMKETAEKYTSMYNPSTFIIPNPIDAELFKPKNSDFSSRRNKGVSVRALGWKYGLDVAVKAYSNMEKANLTIFGKGPLEKYLRKLAKICLSNVVFVTKVFRNRELPALYKQFGYFVAPSRTEAQGVAMCEAMACGLPAVATRVGGIPEYVKNGFNGLLVPPEAPLKLRKAVRLLVSNPKLHTQLSENAANFVKNELSYARIYTKEREVFAQAQEIFGEKRK